MLVAVFVRHWMAPRRNRQQLSSPGGWGARSTFCQPYVPLPLVRGKEPQMISRQPHFDGLTMIVAG